MMFDQLASPDEQLDEMYKILKPVSKQIVGACTSNHSKRSKKIAGIDLDNQLFSRLGRRHIYKGDTGYIVLKCGSQSYKIVFSHGIGSGSNVLADFRKLNSMYPNPDIICASHTHTCLTTSEAYFVLDGRGRKVNRVLFARTGSGIEYPAYAEEQLYKPQPIGYTVLLLGKKERSMMAWTYCEF